MKYLYVAIGIFLGFGGSVIARDITTSGPENYQTGQFVTADNGRDVPMIQLFCELKKGNTKYCRWDKTRYYLTCKGLERFHGEDIKPDENGMYGCDDNTNPIL